MTLSIRRSPSLTPRSAFAGFRFPAEVIVVAVRWHLRYNLSYRDVEELLVERGAAARRPSPFPAGNCRRSPGTAPFDGWMTFGWAWSCRPDWWDGATGWKPVIWSTSRSAPR